MRRTTLLAATAMVVSLMATGAARATTLYTSDWTATAGFLWIDVPYVGAQNVSSLPLAPVDATFTPGPLDYDSDVGGYTVGGFLNNPVFGNQSAAFIAAGGGAATMSDYFSDPKTGTIIHIEGLVNLPTGAFDFQAKHDDGLVISIPGLGVVFNAPTQFDNAVTNGFGFNPGPAGAYHFDLYYGECCTGPAFLQVGVPEPATWALMLLGFFASGLALRGARDRGAVRGLRPLAQP